MKFLKTFCLLFMCHLAQAQMSFVLDPVTSRIQVIEAGKTVTYINPNDYQVVRVNEKKILIRPGAYQGADGRFEKLLTDINWAACVPVLPTPATTEAAVASLNSVFFSIVGGGGGGTPPVSDTLAINRQTDTVAVSNRLLEEIIINIDTLEKNTAIANSYLIGIDTTNTRLDTTNIKLKTINLNLAKSNNELVDLNTAAQDVLIELQGIRDNQTNLTQSTQIVDASGNVINSFGQSPVSFGLNTPAWFTATTNGVAIPTTNVIDIYIWNQGTSPVTIKSGSVTIASLNEGGQWTYPVFFDKISNKYVPYEPISIDAAGTTAVIQLKYKQ